MWFRNLIQFLFYKPINVTNTICYYLAGRIIRPERRCRIFNPRGNQKILVVAPHPDDETIGAGGVACLHKLAADMVTVIVITDGGRSRANGLSPDAMSAKRRREFDEAMKILDVDSIYLELEEFEWDEEAVRRSITPLVRQADIVYTPSCVDYHLDHVKLARLVAGIVNEAQIVRIYEIGVPLTFRLANLIADIRHVRNQKELALSVFQSQNGSIASIKRYSNLTSTSYDMSSIERFWEMSGRIYREIMRYGDWVESGKIPYLGIYPYPWMDILTSIVGYRERGRLKRVCLKAGNA